MENQKEIKKKSVKAENSTQKKKPTKKGVMHSDIGKNIVAIILIVFSLLFLLSLFGQAGVAGSYIDKILSLSFGWGRFLLPVLLLVLGFVYFRKYDKYRYYLTTIGAALFLFFLVAILHSFYSLDEMFEIAKAGKGGGFVGFGIAYVLVKYLGLLSALILAGGVFLIGLILTFNFPLSSFFSRVKDWFLIFVSKLKADKIISEKKMIIKKEEDTNIKKDSIKFANEKNEAENKENSRLKSSTEVGKNNKVEKTGIQKKLIYENWV
jgi:hypothetical protein